MLKVEGFILGYIGVEENCWVFDYMEFNTKTSIQLACTDVNKSMYTISPFLTLQIFTAKLQQ